jgi:hypothetical protein
MELAWTSLIISLVNCKLKFMCADQGFLKTKKHQNQKRVATRGERIISYLKTVIVFPFHKCVFNPQKMYLNASCIC